MLILSMGCFICAAVETALTWYRRVKTVYKNLHAHQMLGKVSTYTGQNRSVATLITLIGQQLYSSITHCICGVYFLAKLKALEELRSTIPALSLIKTMQKRLKAFSLTIIPSLEPCQNT